jgi:hypothetical protein
VKYLAFERASERSGLRRIRTAGFEERSHLPVSAACLVANGMREALASLLRADVRLRVFEPCVPSNAGWHAIAHGAAIYRLRGTGNEAAIVLRPADALALASSAFGEPPPAQRALSPIERRVLDRAVAAIAGALTPVCGPPEGPPACESAALSCFAAYIELRVSEPVTASIGVALAHDPAPEPAARLAPETLQGVELVAALRVPVGSLSAGALARLECGDILPMTEGRALHGRLELAGTPIAQGECGVVGDRYALAVARTLREEGGTAAA